MYLSLIPVLHCLRFQQSCTSDYLILECSGLFGGLVGWLVDWFVRGTAWVMVGCRLGPGGKFGQVGTVGTFRPDHGGDFEF